MSTSDRRIQRISDRLLAAPEPVADLSALKPDWEPLNPINAAPVEAAVLIALVARGDGFSVLYTERSPELRAHSGQIAFPGGKIDPEDGDAGTAALREAAEEVALVQDDAQIIGYMPHYYTGTNYLITPVVAVVSPQAPFLPNPREVQSVFEVPLPLIAQETSYGTYRVRRGEVEHTTWQIDHEGRIIWGITANLTRRFRDIALAGDERW